MRTYYVFQAEGSPGLRGFTDDPDGTALPPDQGPWTFVRQISPDDEWNLDLSRAIVATGILENGFFLWGPISRPPSSRPVIESDRVEGTAVYDLQARQIGTIKRLLIEKVTGRVLYVDVTFGGFLGIGVRHHTIPWDKLSYDTELEGYRTDITEDTLRSAPALYGDDQVWPDRHSQREFQEYWQNMPRGPF